MARGKEEQGTARGFGRRYNLVLYMCCVYIVTYLAWNSHNAPHALITEHHQVNKQLQHYVQSGLGDSQGAHGGVGDSGKGNKKKGKNHKGRGDVAGDGDATAGFEEVIGAEDAFAGAPVPEEAWAEVTGPGPGDENFQDSGGQDWAEGEEEGEEEKGGEEKSSPSASKGRKGRKRKTFKYHPTHVAMSKTSIPMKGKDLVTPWKDLRGKCCRTLGVVTDKMIDLLPDRDLLDPNETQYRTCAVVGSAGLLLTQEFGEEIDEHDAIFRFNIAPAKGFEKHVGSRTTIRMINRHHLGFREFKDEICLFHCTLDEAMRKFMRIAQKHPNLPNVPMDMSFYKKVVEWNKLETPTNGYFGLKLALMLCDKIDIYGFLRTWKGYVKYHYFNDEEPNSRQLSRDTKGEMPIILDLLSTHADKIHFKHPCIVDQECKGCPRGSHCDGKTPYAVPKPGFCKVEGKNCFLECKKPTKCHSAAPTCSPLMEGIDEC
ncbi:sialyltransferase [Chloropicon primus]|uniref:beta-galactoside alpha-(2,6)-sialyltransferase n=1 Tax=Chloropicon primus TaxID=1764295 RepID=A0A5B8MT32_9CHLO|nr:sialyltransferase [Chloropicon primus]UPR03159.1 sialyltransferase [Chloropicon primus]|eukprot:QDZ23948.1 sialyltransferase [Chloropicon primus]